MCGYIILLGSFFRLYLKRTKTSHSISAPARVCVWGGGGGEESSRSESRKNATVRAAILRLSVSVTS